MHTVIVVGGGFALLLACVLLGHAFGGGMPGLLTGAKLFIPLWLLGAALNTWIGVRQAGYSAAEEPLLGIRHGPRQTPDRKRQRVALRLNGATAPRSIVFAHLQYGCRGEHRQRCAKRHRSADFSTFPGAKTLPKTSTSFLPESL